jgi:Tol biopolymer transport system component
MRDRSTVAMPVPESKKSARVVGRSGPSRRVVIGLSAAFVVVAAVVWWMVSGVSPRGGPAPRLVPFTTLPGLLRQPAFSPEGNQIAFAWNGGQGDSFSIYTQLVDAGSPLRLTTSPGQDGSPAWSPDGRFVAFLRSQPRGWAYFIVPALGGPERPLRPSFGVPYSYGRSIDWSPDGGQLAIVDHGRADQPLNILLVGIDTGDVKPLLARPFPYLQNPRFSSDGRTLAFVGGAGFLSQDIYVMTLPDGAPRRLTTDGRHIAGITWSGDGREILFSSNRGGLFGIWTVPAAGGEPELVNAVGEDAYAPSLSPRAGHLAYLRMRVDWNLWRVPGPRAASPGDPPSRLIYSTREEWQPAYSPDDSRIAFVSSRSGSQEIWVANSDGTGAVQLTTFRGPPTGTPRWSPDGRRLVIDSRVRGDADIFVINVDDRTTTRLTNEPSEDVVPSWSHDGRWVYFTSDRDGRDRVWKAPADGGVPVRVLDTPARDLFESADGQMLYYWRSGAIWSRAVGGGAETRVTDHPRWGSWILRDEGIYLLNEDAQPKVTIDFLSFATGTRTVVRELEPWPHVTFPPAFDLSHDGRWFIFGRVDQIQNDVMLIQHFR